MRRRFGNVKGRQTQANLPRGRSLVRHLAVPLVAVVLLAGCSTDPVGPLGNGGDQGAECAPGRIGEPVTVGLYDLHNYGKSPVKISGITLPPLRGLKRTGSWWLTPVLRDPRNGNWVDIGAGFPFPPTFSKLAREEWRRRRPLIGAVLRPHQDLTLVFVLSRTAANSSAGDLTSVDVQDLAGDKRR